MTVRETLSQNHAEVERVATGEFVADMPQIRQQGDVTIIPVVEEILFVEKRLFLKEEIRIRRTTTTQLHEQTVTLRREEAVIERDAANLASTPVAPDQGAPTPKESHHGQ